MSSADLFIMGTAAGAFLFFVLIHFLAFRFLKDEQLLSGITRTAILAGLVDLGLCWKTSVSGGGSSLLLVLTLSLLSFLVYGLMVFVYVVCVFGPYETSIRMRLVREIAAAGPQGVTQEDLFRKYNAGLMLKVRLQRLTGAGDLIEHNGRYTLRKHQNMFFIIDAAAFKLQGWIQREP